MGRIAQQTLPTILATLALTAVKPTPTFAGVNMKDASFVRKFIDAEIKPAQASRSVNAKSSTRSPGSRESSESPGSPNSLLSLERVYSSRSRFSGLFGFGWCSTLDTKLIAGKTGKTDKTEPVIDECGTQTSFSSQLGQGDNVLRARTPSTGTLVRSGELWIRTMPNGSQQKFDSGGRLIGWSDGSSSSSSSSADPNAGARNGTGPTAGSELRLEYDPGGLLRGAATGEGVRLRFVLDAITRKVTRILDGDAVLAEYRYDGEDLVWVRNAWKNAYSYRYDSLHNLTRIDYPDRSYESLTYDQDRDWIVSFQGRDKCSETYSYRSNPLDPKKHFSSEANKSCGGRQVASVTFDFWHDTAADGRVMLSKVRITRGRTITDYQYDSSARLPVKISRSKVPDRQTANREE